MRTWERGILIGYGMIREIDGTNQGPDWGKPITHLPLMGPWARRQDTVTH